MHTKMCDAEAFFLGLNNPSKKPIFMFDLVVDTLTSRPIGLNDTEKAKSAKNTRTERWICIF